MAALEGLFGNPDRCQNCQKGGKDYRIHDKRCVEFRHFDKKTPVGPNKGLIIAEGALGGAGDLVHQAGQARADYKAQKFQHQSASRPAKGGGKLMGGGGKPTVRGATPRGVGGRAGGLPRGKVGAPSRFAAGATVIGAGLGAAQGIIGAINTANAEPEDDERCSKCSRVFTSPPCTAWCSACGGYCVDNDWKKAAPDGPCCFQVCSECYRSLLG